ncbi:MAG: tRNA (adenosine(37)-N6)-threonylcarbamoyltransferase complex dimerization subunit type 1 TsaB [Gemmatimonadaceae bacterium]
MITLALDASTYTGSVAVADGASILAVREATMRGADAERLLPAVASALDASGIAAGDLDAIVCGGGPGSFTSLRIAGSIAKGIAEATGRPLFAVPSLLLAVAGMQPPALPGRYLPLLDAMRDEYYAALIEVGSDGTFAGGSDWHIIARTDAGHEADRLEAIAVGAGTATDVAPHARGIARLERWLGECRPRCGPVDLAAWEPDYGRVAEAQRRWEAAAGRPLPAA